MALTRNAPHTHADRNGQGMSAAHACTILLCALQCSPAPSTTSCLLTDSGDSW